MEMTSGIVAIKPHPHSTDILGTGFFISGGLILTCAHVIDPFYHPGGTVYFQAEDQSDILGASVVFYSPPEQYDLAVLKPDQEAD